MRRSRQYRSTTPYHWMWQAGFLLVAAFLIHDGYMAVEGHAMAGEGSAHHAGMTAAYETHDELAGLVSEFDIPGVLAFGSASAPAGVPICPTERPAVAGNRDSARHIEPGDQRPPFIPSPDVNSSPPLALTVNLGRDLPPSCPPDEQRAMFQVYRI
ncbi:MAG: hypothetical protein ACR2OU_09265 [Thermomicrobiales bacterium]